MYRNIINKLTKENYVVELHGINETKKFKMICEEYCISADIIIRSFGCTEIKDQDKIYAVYSVVPGTSFSYKVVLFYHGSFYTVPDNYNIICFNNNNINNKNELISWIK